MKKDFFKDLGPGDRAVVENALRNREEVDGWPEKFTCSYLESGLAYYESEDGGEEGDMVLVRKDAMDKMRPTFIGKPLVNEIHKDADRQNFCDIADGVVSRVWHNAEDGWDYCEFIVWDEATKKNVKSGAYSVSCAYKPTDVDPAGGEHHNVKYTAEILNGEYTHLAVVRNPRYEGARIILNSKGGRTMKFSFWQKDKKNAKEIDPESTFKIDGKEVSMKDLINAHKKKNESQAEEIGDDTIIEIDGTEMPFSNLKEAYRKNMKDEEHKEEEKKNMEEEERKKAEEKENEAEEEKKEEEKKNAKKKAAAAAADKKQEDLRNARLGGKPTIPTMVTAHERVAEGAKRYGSAPAK